jgi:DnaJ domain
VLTTDSDYQLLGVRPGASSQEIREAYRDLIRVWHPDRFEQDSKLRARAEKTTKELNAAYRRLSRSHRGRSRTSGRGRTYRPETRPTIRPPHSAPAPQRESPTSSRSDRAVTALLRLGLGVFFVIGVLFVGLGVFNARHALPGNGIARGATTATTSGGSVGSRPESRPPGVTDAAPGPATVRPSGPAELVDAGAGPKAVADAPARLGDEQITASTDRGAPVDLPPRRVGTRPTAEDVDLALIERFLKAHPRSDGLDPAAPLDWLMKKPVR